MSAAQAYVSSSQFSANTQLTRMTISWILKLSSPFTSPGAGQSSEHDYPSPLGTPHSSAQELLSPHITPHSQLQTHKTRGLLPRFFQNFPENPGD